MKAHLDRHRSGYWKGELIRGQKQNQAVTVMVWMESVSEEGAERGSVRSVKQQEG